MLKETIPSVASSITPADLQGDLGVFLQERGSNLRFLGRVRTLCTDPSVRFALLTEMIARVTQKHHRAQWRGQVAGRNSSLPSLKIAVDVLNAVRFGEPEWLRLALLQKYGQDAPLHHEPLHANVALKRICDLSGLSVLPAALSAPEPVTFSDVAMDALVKELGLSLLARADELMLEVKTHQKSG
jgi:hypothetical protein